MYNLQFHAGFEVGKLNFLYLRIIFLECMVKDKAAADKIWRSNRPDVQSQHPGAGNVMVGQSGPPPPGVPPGHGPPPQGGMQYK